MSMARIDTDRFTVIENNSSELLSDSAKGVLLKGVPISNMAIQVAKILLRENERIKAMWVIRNTCPGRITLKMSKDLIDNMRDQLHGNHIFYINRGVTLI